MGQPSTLIVFDLDGTLVDTLDDLTASANRLLAALGGAPVTPAVVRPMVGDGLAALVRRLLAHAGIATDEAAAIRGFSEDYESNAAVASRLFPGVMQTLRQLREMGCRFAVCTNKPEAAARSVLDALGVTPWLDAIGGGDSFATRKPDPGHLLGCIDAARGAANGGVSGALLVGDHANDVAAARGAGVPCIFALWGYGPARMAEGSQAIATSITEVPGLVGLLLGV